MPAGHGHPGLRLELHEFGIALVGAVILLARQPAARRRRGAVSRPVTARKALAGAQSWARRTPTRPNPPGPRQPPARPGQADRAADASGGRPIVAGCGAGRASLLRRLWRPLGLPSALLTAWCAWFFREPRRVTPTPARHRGGARPTAPCPRSWRRMPPAELGLRPRRCCGSACSCPSSTCTCSGCRSTARSARISYRPGKFLSADLDKAQRGQRAQLAWRCAPRTARTWSWCRSPGWSRAGSCARSPRATRPWPARTYGLIRFGSRVDTYVPLGSRVLVEPGQHTIGGETVLAELGG